MTKQDINQWIEEKSHAHFSKFAPGWDVHIFIEEHEDDAAAWCKAMPEYRNAQITLNMTVLADVDPSQLDKIFLHEALHIVVSDFKILEGCLQEPWQQFLLNHVEERVVKAVEGVVAP